jgi:fumarate reductase iron-sulfur subunit
VEYFLKIIIRKRSGFEPLLGFPVERDLITVMDDFMNKLKDISPWIIRETGEMPVEKGEYLQKPEQLAKFNQFTMCINCMLCYSACPVYVVDNNFVGPAAIALAQRYNLDSRDQGSQKREEYIAQEEGIWQCTFVGECSQVCPKNVDPAAAIQQAKVIATQKYFKSLLWPFGGKQ